MTLDLDLLSMAIGAGLAVVALIVLLFALLASRGDV